MNFVDRCVEVLRAFGRWLGERPASTVLIAGWVVFVLGCYPGYLSFDSTMQLFDVRNGVYRDNHPALMSGMWSLLEWVSAGPFPMLLLQSGLFLFGLAATLRTVLTPRAAAVTAVGVLLFPPVYAPMAVIWPESLMVGALLAATGCFLVEQWKWRIAGALLIVLALSCRPEAVVAVGPLVLLGVPKAIWWRRVAIAIVVTLGLLGVARLTDTLLTDVTTYEPRQALMVTDIFGTLRRAHVTDEKRAAALMQGLPLTSPDHLHQTLLVRSAVLDWWSFTHGANAVLDPISTDDQSEALGAAWRRVIRAHPGSYLKHRWIFAKYMVALTGKAEPVYDSFGDPTLIGSLHHRASTSDWQVGMQWFVRLFEHTPLFWPWCYVLLAVAGIVIARRRPILRILLASGLVFVVSMMFFAPAPDYRFCHWLVTVTCAAGAALAVGLRASWRVP